jgi:aminopeptidase N
MKKIVFLLLGTAILVQSCKTAKKTEPAPATPAPVTEEAAAPQILEPSMYKGSRTKINDILHTRLEVSFDYAKQYLYGKATLTIKPYYYPSFYLDLDAVGFDIKKLELVGGKESKILPYTYDGKVITVKLDRIYKNNEEYKIYIEYTARPNEVAVEGSAAINDAKGLYFINPLGKEKNKPIQIWTQGETQASSVWYPTIDAPNERFTQEIYMTVDTQYVTLSNGLLVSSKVNGDGTRTDYWKQSLPAAPYLTMMAVGKFAVIRSKWRKLDVNYYVEPEYAKYAKQIFGNTPDMMEFFSNRLGVDYPWEKFSQVVVRDYVSGAMENTSAVLHGEFLQRTDRELLDNTNEDVIAHELFHQWFGDLVTCESWANLPLNESFATYGEYLWDEFRYGADAADLGLQKGLNVYLQQARTKNENLIRYYHGDKEEMFDAISYQKGGHVLHMLRRYVGDDAFFAALKHYLSTHKFKSVEIHDLRLSFEEITGEDLNWFFNQWFMGHGHPDLDINYSYNDTTGKTSITVTQKQDLSQNPIFKLPLDVDIYVKGKLEKHRVVVNKPRETFSFDVPSRPNLVNFDADKMLLCTKTENKTPQELAYQYYNAPLYLDRYEAIQGLVSLPDSDYVTVKVLLDALNDKFWNIRLLATRSVDKTLKFNSSSIRQKLVKLAQEDEQSDVRAGAISALAKHFNGSDLNALYKEKISDPSYMVMGAALEAYGQKQPKEALALAKGYEGDKSPGMIKAITSLYMEKGGEEQNAYFLEALGSIKGVDLYLFVQSYGKFLLKCSDKTILQSVRAIEDIGRNSSLWYVRLSAVQTLSEIAKKYEDEELKMNGELTAMTREGKPAADITRKSTEISEVTRKKSALQKIVESIKKNEKDVNLMRIYGTATEEAN